MPDHHRDAQEMERFHAAVDRLAAGVPAPMVDDADLQELLDLAGRLRHDLPSGMPDPAFRASLKQRLIEPYSPNVVPLPERTVSRVARFPYVAATGAVAAVFVAVFVVAAFALMGNGNDDGTPDLAGGADGGTETARLSTLSAVASPTANEVGTGGDPTGGVGDATVETVPPDSAGSPTPVLPSNTPTVTQGEPAPTPFATLIATAQPTPAPTSEPQLAMVLPPVDATTVESGPVPATDDGAGGNTARMTFLLSTTLPEVPPNAPAYLLSPPDQDPVALVTRIGRELGIEGEVRISEDRGKMDYHLGTEDGRAFHWQPETGSFSFVSPDASSNADMTREEVIANCRGWLSSFGYPVEALTMAATAQPIGDANWLVETPMDSMPQPGYGHPLGVRMITNSDGKVVDASGYWLKPAMSMDVDLISAAEAWESLTSGKGYWFGGGGAFAEGGELRVESIDISYVLTNDSDGLFLQPVFAMRGELLHADGISSSGVTVFIQASRPQARYSGP
jgi:hypothetical protein